LLFRLIGILGTIFWCFSLLMSFAVASLWGGRLTPISILLILGSVLFLLSFLLSAYYLHRQKKWAYAVGIIQVTVISFFILNSFLYNILVSLAFSQGSFLSRVLYNPIHSIITILFLILCLIVIKFLYSEKQNFFGNNKGFNLLYTLTVLVCFFILFFSIKVVGGEEIQQGKINIESNSQYRYNNELAIRDVVTVQGTVTRNLIPEKSSHENIGGSTGRISFFDPTHSNNIGNSLYAVYNYQRDRGQCLNIVDIGPSLKVGDKIEVRGIVEEYGVEISTCDSSDYYIKKI
jgi:hypothetical protein